MRPASPASPSREAWGAWAAWLLVATGMFYYCWSDPALDDFSGWIPGVVVLQLPAAWAIAQPISFPGGAPLRGGRGIGLTVSASLVTLFGAVVAMVQLGWWVWDLEHLGVARVMIGAVLTIAGIGALVAVPIRAHRRNLVVAHPLGARRSLQEVSVVAGLTIAITLATLGFHSLASAPGLWLVVATPLLWVAPLWLLLPRARTAPRAVVLTR